MKKIDLKAKLQQFQQLILLAAVILILSLALPGMFFTGNNFVSVLLSVSLYGIMVAGAIFPVLLGGIDRTVSGVAALAGTICVQSIVRSGYSMKGFVVGTVLGLLLGIFSGALHGLILANFNIPPFLLTLATSQVLYGFAQVVTQNMVIFCMQPRAFTVLGTGRLLNVPVPVYILCFFLLVSYFLLQHTTLGRKIYCVGGNREASQLSGINTKRVITIGYSLSGLMAAVAGIVLSSMNQQAIWNAAEGYENDVLAAIVVGGVSLSGGEGSVQGAVFGVLLIGLINNGMRLLSLPSTYHSVVKGVIIIVAVAIDMRTRYNNSGLKRKNRLLARLTARAQR